MSVYTPVSARQLAAFLRRYDLGPVTNLQGVPDGIENTNYFLNTERGAYVLTLFEQYTVAEIPYFLQLMAHLAKRGIPSAHPVADRNGEYLNQLNERPAAIVQRLQGASLEKPSPRHCAAVGHYLAMIHKQGADFPLQKECSRDYAWCRRTAHKVLPLLPTEEQEMIRAELAYQAEHDFLQSPCGVIHADLFRDNVLFVGDKLSGIIDFYYSCHWPFIYDLAVAVNDWCNNGNAGWDEVNIKALLEAYRQIREVQPGEIELWPVVLRAAALRFWLSRLKDKHFPRSGTIIHIKDPATFAHRLHRNICKGERARDMWQFDQVA